MSQLPARLPAARTFRRLKKQARIAVVAPASPAEYFGLLWEGVRSAATEISSLGMRVDPISLAGQDIGPQRELLGELLKAPPDAVALVPAHASALNDLIEELSAKGTAIVTFNVDAPLSRRCSYVGPDARKSGALAAEVLTRLMGIHGAVISFPGPLEKGHLAERYRGFLSDLTRWRADAHIVACHQGLDRLREAAAGLLRENREIGGIYVGNARAYEIGAAMEEIGCHIPCVGFDNTPAVRPFLEKNLVSAVIDQNAYQQGYVAVQRAYEILTARRLPSRPTLIPSTVVFASNAGDPASTDTLNEAFESLVRRRTARMRSYQRLLQEANHQLLHLAETDGLTGLYNRRKIEFLLDDHLARCSAHSPLSFLMIDVNQFKSYNDRWGHETGDEALRVLARVMSEQVRMPDCCGRIGGDEFCILLPNTDAEAAEAVRNRIHRALAEAVIPVQSARLSLEVSIGVATAPADGESPSDLLRAADQDMYAQKNLRSMVTA
jgi:diguanylate cyclase (GGDEF)-like protein